MAIYTTAQWTCKEGSESIVEAALRQFVAAVKENEPGTRIYTALQQKESKTSFMTYFIFEDEKARDFHRSTDWVKHFTEIIYPQNEELVVFTEFRLIASTDS